MKRPILDQWDREHIRHDTYRGSKLRVHLAWLGVKRELDKTIKPYLN